jgi:hypothetical protein
MDMRLYMRVIGRFKWIFLVGLVLAAGLGVLSTAKVHLNGVSVPKLTYRKQASYRAQALLLVTQSGFPEGRSNLGDLLKVAEATTPGGSATYVPRFADPGRYSELALIYSTYATSDQIYAQMRKAGGPVVGKILANPLVQPGTGSAEPIIVLAGIAPSPSSAILLTKRVIRALKTFLSEQQAANNVPKEKRALIVPLNSPQTATVFQGHKITKPLFVFLAILLATIGICFLLENVRPRSARVSSSPDEQHGPVLATAAEPADVDEDDRPQHALA